jgi:hypothetical protein
VHRAMPGNLRTLSCRCDHHYANTVMTLFSSSVGDTARVHTLLGLGACRARRHGPFTRSKSPLRPVARFSDRHRNDFADVHSEAVDPVGFARVVVVEHDEADVPAIRIRSADRAFDDVDAESTRLRAAASLSPLAT